jgi:hypothetical protein
MMNSCALHLVHVYKERDTLSLLYMVHISIQKPNRKAKTETTMKSRLKASLTSESVEGTSLALEGIDDIEGCDSLALGVLSVGDGVTDDRLKEGLENSTGLLVDHWTAGLVYGCDDDKSKDLLAEIRLTPPRRARRRIAGFVIPWMLSRRIFR